MRLLRGVEYDFTLYRIYDDSELLYVGITTQLSKRLQQHRYWTETYAAVRVESEHLGVMTFEDAHRFETKAICIGLPRLNRCNNPRRWNLTDAALELHQRHARGEMTDREWRSLTMDQLFEYRAAAS